MPQILLVDGGTAHSHGSSSKAPLDPLAARALLSGRQRGGAHLSHLLHHQGVGEPRRNAHLEMPSSNGLERASKMGCPTTSTDIAPPRETRFQVWSCLSTVPEQTRRGLETGGRARALVRSARLILGVLLILVLCSSLKQPRELVSEDQPRRCAPGRVFYHLT